MLDIFKISLAGMRGRIRAKRAKRAVHKLERVTCIGITGSSGKTTTAELLGHILSGRTQTQTFAGHNSLKSVQENIIRTKTGLDFAVQEISGHKPGAIAQAAKYFPIRVGIVTIIGLEHRESFQSSEDIAAEKGELIKLLPSDGLAILNADDEHVLRMGALSDARTVTFGWSDSADLRCLSYDNRFPDGIQLELVYRNESFYVTSKLIGRHWTVAIMASITAGLALGVSRKECCDALASFTPRFGRCSVHNFENNAYVLHDAYKAPEWSLSTFLELVSEIPATRKTLVLGDFTDSKRKRGSRYRQLVRKALKYADRVIVIGSDVEQHFNSLQKEVTPDRLRIASDIQIAADAIRSTSQAGEVFFLKSGISLHLERILLDWQAPIQCWVAECGKRIECIACKQLRN